MADQAPRRRLTGKQPDPAAAAVAPSTPSTSEADMNRDPTEVMCSIYWPTIHRAVCRFHAQGEFDRFINALLRLEAVICLQLNTT